MTIQLEKTYVQYQGNGVDTSFAFNQNDFTVMTSSQVGVQITKSNGDIIILRATDFEVILTPISANDDNYLYTGRVNLINLIPANSDLIKLYRETPITQEMILNENARISPKGIEKLYDRFVHIIQEIKYQGSVSLGINGIGNVALPPIDQRENKVLGFVNNNLQFRDETIIYVSDLARLARNSTLDTRKSFMDNILGDWEFDFLYNLLARMTTASIIKINRFFHSIADFKFSAQSLNHKGWLLCDGGLVSQIEYAELYNIIGHSFIKSTDLLNTLNTNLQFRLPDARGRVIGGIGQGEGLTSRNIGDVLGEENHTLTVPELPQITIYGVSTEPYGSYAAGGGNMGSWTTQTFGGNQTHNNMQPTLFAGNMFIFAGK